MHIHCVLQAWVVPATVELSIIIAKGFERVQSGHGCGAFLRSHFEIKRNGLHLQLYEWTPGTSSI